MVNVSVTDIPKKDLAFVLITALEQGIGYWAGKCIEEDGERFVMRQHKDLRGNVVKEDVEFLPVRAVLPVRDEKDMTVTITLETIRLGIERFLTKVISGEMSGHHFSYLSGHGVGGMDCQGADLVVQLGLWGEVRYG